MAGLKRIKKRLTGFLLEDIATYSGFAGVPLELAKRLGLRDWSKGTETAVLTREQAKEAMRVCFALLGEPVMRRTEKDGRALGLHPGNPHPRRTGATQSR